MRERTVIVMLIAGFLILSVGSATQVQAPVAAKSLKPERSIAWQSTLDERYNAAEQENIAVSSYQVRTPRPLLISRGRSYDRRDVELLARAVYAEARGEPFVGQVAVGAVLVNRTHDPGFPSTIQGVIFQPGALCTVRDGQINLKPDVRARRAAIMALSGVDPTNGSLYFYNPTATSKWMLRRPTKKHIGRHLFAR